MKNTSRTSVNKALISILCTPNPIGEADIVALGCLARDQVQVVEQYTAELADLVAELRAAWTMFHFADTAEEACRAAVEMRKASTAVGLKVALMRN